MHKRRHRRREILLTGVVRTVFGLRGIVVSAQKSFRLLILRTMEMNGLLRKHANALRSFIRI